MALRLDRHLYDCYLHHFGVIDTNALAGSVTLHFSYYKPFIIILCFIMGFLMHFGPTVLNDTGIDCMLYLYFGTDTSGSDTTGSDTSGSARLICTHVGHNPADRFPQDSHDD